MAFSTENRKISDIFQRSAVYCVPRYQRDYVWKEVNWRDLLKDIQFTMQNDQNLTWSHFLGTIVLSDNGDNGVGIAQYEIIDGQQRLMTIYVMLIALYAAFENNKSEEAAQRSSYLYETYITAINKNSQRILLINNDKYDNDLKELIDASRDGGVVGERNMLRSLYSFFNSEFNSRTFEYLDTFLDKLLSVNIVEIVSSEDEEIYNIFEVLNARGQKLKQIELLKNHIMKYIQPRTDDFVDRVRIKWQYIEDNVSNLNDPDKLIQHFTRCYIDKDADNKDSIYRLVKEEVPISELNSFLEELYEFSEVYKVVAKRNSDNPVLMYFQIKRNTQIRSLLSAIYFIRDKGVISDEEVDVALIQIRNFFFLFNSQQLSSNKIDNLMSKTSFLVYHCQYSAEFKMIMTNFFVNIARHVDVSTAKSSFCENRTFRYSNRNKSYKRNRRLVKYLLLHYLQYYQMDLKLFNDDLTIEHLTSDNGTDENSSIWHLTLTSEQINNFSLKDYNLAKKVDILRENSNITKNQKLFEYFEGNEFNFNSRKVDMVDDLFDLVFKFDKWAFHLNQADIDKYNRQMKIVKNDSDLCMLLKESGIHFENRLENDPKLKSHLESYRNLTNHI